MTDSYNHNQIEKKWSEIWNKNNLYKIDLHDDVKPKKYILDMYPYPSGAAMHVGHVEGYVATDILARYFKLKGYNVLHPIGFDAFGLPAENYAIKTNIHPKISTDKAIDYFKEQLSNMGFNYDMSLEIASHRPEYYRWTQWFFSLLYKNDLAYKKEAPVNWCDGCMTTLANEQVVNGKCERCDTVVVQKNMSQWFFRITKYADRLINGLKNLDWPNSTKINQINWIGKSEGAEIDFEVENKNIIFKDYHAQIKNGETVLITKPNVGDAQRYEEIIAQGWQDNNIYEENGINAEFHKRNKYPDNPKQNRIDKRIAWLSDTETPNRSFIARDVDGRLIGFCDYFITDGKNEIGIYIDRNYRGLGLGSLLMDCFLKYFGYKELYLEVTQGNNAINLYEKYGFKKICETFQELDEGKKLPLYRMFRDPIYSGKSIRIYTTRLDTIYGCSFVAIAPEKFVEIFDILSFSDDKQSEISKYVEDTKKMTQLERQENKEKSGIDTGIFAINPFNNEKVPVYIANFILPQYGTGAIMGVPAHDERDFVFATKYNLPIKQVIVRIDSLGNVGCNNINYNDCKNCTCKDGDCSKLPFVEYENGILKDSGQYTSQSCVEAFEDMIDYALEKGFGQKKVNYKLRDWLLCRQRYWGAPVPIVYDPDGNTHLLPDEDLPILLPDEVEFKPTGESPLKNSTEFHKSIDDTSFAKNLGGNLYEKGWRREVDTMDGFVCSSWYFLRFIDPANSDRFADIDLVKKWLPVDSYHGGSEHTVLHLLYARFFTMVLHDLGYIDFDEPFIKLRHQGMILGEDGRKMSKRWGNVIDPKKVCEELGADSLRLFEMFMGPLEAEKPWSTTGIQGSRRFLDRIYKYIVRIFESNFVFESQDTEVEIELNKLIKKVGVDIENMKFNTAVSESMKFLNFVENKVMSKDQIIKFLKILNPFAPFMTEELYHIITNVSEDISLYNQDWPSFDENLLTTDKVKIAVQINGKVRSSIEITADMKEEDIKANVLADPLVLKWLVDKVIKEYRYIKGKIISINI